LRINDLLGAFMFGGEASEKKVKVLSGGERSRLAMIRLLLQPVNFLILDEPTNHLDMPSKDVLKEAIRAFDGTAIIVSHDRYFLDGLVSKVYEFGGGRVKEHLGGIYDYLEEERREKGGENALAGKENEREIKGKKGEDKETLPKDNVQRSTYEERKEIQKKIRKAERAVKETEDKIAEMEKRLGELDELFAIPENAANMTFVNEYAEIKQKLDEENERWMTLSEELEAAQSELGN